MNKILALAAAVALAGGFAVAAYAQGSASKEVSTAHAHAMMAQGAGTVAKAHMHLHHVINCIVGSNGTGFDGSAGNPCKGQGNGALNDAKGDAALQGKLKQALADANTGLKSSDLSTVHKDAAKAAAALQATPTQKSSGGYSW